VQIVKDIGVRNTVVNGMREADQIKNVITVLDMNNIILKKAAITVEMKGVHHMVPQDPKTHTDRKKVIWTQEIIFERG
tara:strand:- start:67 stop:300 length:234 start_codon:yes stop_codon:yes gene_type:complete